MTCWGWRCTWGATTRSTCSASPAVPDTTRPSRENSYRRAGSTATETATGFRLAGVEVREAATPQEALEHLRQLAALDYGLAAVNEALLEGLDEDLARLVRGGGE